MAKAIQERADFTEAKENQSKGADHGAILRQLDSSGNIAFAVDFRSVYAVLERWRRVLRRSNCSGHENLPWLSK